MGNNAAYEQWARAVLASHKFGKLDAEIVDIYGENYRGVDMDWGNDGPRQRTPDGKSADELVIELLLPDFQPTEDWTAHDEFLELSRSRWGWK